MLLRRMLLLEDDNLRWDEMILSENENYWITALHHLEASWLSNFVLCAGWFRPDSINSLSPIGPSQQHWPLIGQC